MRRIVLTNFFRLNTPANSPLVNCNEPLEFLQILQTQDSISDLVYRPDTFEPSANQRRIKSKTFRNVSFSKTKIVNVTFTNCKFEDCLFIDTSISGCWFNDCDFKCVNFHRVRIENTYMNPNSLNQALDKRKHTNIGLNLFSQLLKDNKGQQNISFARSAEFMYWSWHRYRIWHKLLDGDQEIRPNFVKSIRLFFEWIISKMLSVASGYGLKPLRFISISLFLLTTVALFLYTFRSEFAFTSSDRINTESFEAILYYTAVTATTLGYGDITPTSELGMLVASCISVAGLVWLGALTSVIVKWFSR